jgi:hypothetical protein
MLRRFVPRTRKAFHVPSLRGSGWIAPASSANTHAPKNRKNITPRAPPKRVRTSFVLLTKTYHGSRLLEISKSINDYPVCQELDSVSAPNRRQALTETSISHNGISDWSS